MKLIAILVFGFFLYASYYYWLKYPLILDRLFKHKDARLKATLSKIWFLNVNARAIAINKLMERTTNQTYIEAIDSSLKNNYFKAKKYWYWSLLPLGVLIVASQLEQGYEIFFHREQFQEKFDNSWFKQAIDKLLNK